MNKKQLYKEIGMINDDLVIKSSDRAKKTRKIKMTALIASAVIVFSLAAATATNMFNTKISVSSSIGQYTSVPSAETIKKDIGFDANILDTFSNGYTFSNARMVKDMDIDENGKTTETSKGLLCFYNHLTNQVSLSITLAEDDVSDHDIPADIHNDTKIMYHSYENKLVPGDYEMTEQDRLDEASGKYVFSFGSEKAELITVQGVGFKLDNLRYNLLAMDVDITEAELVSMAKEIIDAQK